MVDRKTGKPFNYSFKGGGGANYNWGLLVANWGPKNAFAVGEKVMEGLLQIYRYTVKNPYVTSNPLIFPLAAKGHWGNSPIRCSPAPALCQFSWCQSLIVSKGIAESSSQVSSISWPFHDSLWLYNFSDSRSDTRLRVGWSVRSRIGECITDLEGLSSICRAQWGWCTFVTSTHNALKARIHYPASVFDGKTDKVGSAITNSLKATLVCRLVPGDPEACSTYLH